MAAPRRSIRPTAALVAVLATLTGGAIYGAVSALLPLVKLDAVILTAAAMGGYLTHAGLQRGLLANLGVALVSGALAVLAMWSAWVAAEYSPRQVLWLVQQGPAGAYAYLAHLAQSTTMVIRGASGMDWTQGPGMVRWFWLAETGVVALAPVLGALWSPVARRRMQALA